MAIYNDFDEARFMHAVKSLHAQEGVVIEVNVAESNTEPRLEKRLRELGVRYTFSPSSAVANPGQVRNLALSSATGDFVYSTDADIVLPPRFLADLINLSPCVWIHPPKRRLPKNQFAVFDSRVQAQGLAQTLASLRCDPYFASLEEIVPYRLSEKAGRQYTCILSDYALWRSSPELRERAPTFWDSTRHHGGTLALRSHWLEVGGYADVYRAWGYEDADVQWKLSTRCPLSEIPNEDRFRTLHLDHEKTYFSPQHHLENKQRFEERKIQPADTITHDRLRFKALES
jgi:hypothetical protein